MRFLVKWPTRGRPEKFFESLDRYLAMASGHHPVQFVVTLDEDDDTMNTDEVRTRLDAVPDLRYRYGTSPTKIAAYNADMDLAGDWDILIASSDDMLPQSAAYDEAIVRDMTRWFPTLDGALHYNDGRMGDRICTLSIVGRRLYDDFGYIYHPAYRSFWCDNEFTEVCYAAGKMVYRPQVLIAHAWIAHTGTDTLYHRNLPDYDRDGQLYAARRNAGFPRDRPDNLNSPA